MPATFDGKVTASVVKVSAIIGKAHGPGEVGGPSVELQIRLSNLTKAPLGLGSVVVTVDDAARVPASPLSGAPAQGFHETLASGASAVGTYVFALPADHKNPLSITLSYSADAPAAVFTASIN